MTTRKRRGGWQVIVYAGLDPLTGKQRQITRQVNGSRKQAEKVEARLKTEVEDGRHAATRAKTFAELLDKWIEWRVDNGKPISPRTVNDYRSLIETKIKPALGLAFRWGWVPFNIALAVRPATGKGQARAVPTAEQVRELFEAVADDLELAAFLRLSATTGLRPGEVCALRWCDLDLTASEVSVSGNIVTSKGLPEGYMRRSPKSERGVRVLALDKGTVALLAAYQARSETVARELEPRFLWIHAPGDRGRPAGGAVHGRPARRSGRVAVARGRGGRLTLVPHQATFAMLGTNVLTSWR